MCHRADELPRRITRQLRVGVERDDVLHLREDLRRADDHRKGGGVTAAQQRVQIGKLAAFAFVAHPDPRVRIPATRAVKQIERAGDSCWNGHRICRSVR